MEMGVEYLAILNGEPLEEVNCFKHLGSQVAADGGCDQRSIGIEQQLYEIVRGKNFALNC